MMMMMMLMMMSYRDCRDAHLDQFVALVFGSVELVGVCKSLACSTSRGKQLHHH